MISDQQRHEVAEKMHEIVHMRIEPGWTLDSLIVAAITSSIGAMRQPISETLADLIDRPTCKNVGPHDYFCCSRCKFEHPIAAERLTDTCGKPIVRALHFSYCPNCGAEVVSDDAV